MPGKTPRLSRATKGRASLPPGVVRAQLERILGHRDFEASARTRKFLRFVVEETLAGRDHRLKGYTIAVEVFGRGKDFDANLDPIVRIQAGRLRRALDHYYLVAGGDDPILISVPKGGYVPVFSSRTRPSSGRPAAPRSVLDVVIGSPLGVSVSVLPLQEIPASAETGYFGEGLREELCNELERYQDLGVAPCRKEMLPAGAGGDYRELTRRLGARFFLEGSVRRTGDVLKVSVRLIDGLEDRQIWAEGFRRPLSASDLIEVQEEIARKVAGAIGSELGVISQRLAAEARKVAPTQLSTYEAVLRWYDYQVRPTPEAGAECLVTLRAAVEREPEYGPAWAALSHILRLAYILDLPDTSDPRGQMAEYARRAVSLAPRSQLARAAVAYSHYTMRERDAFLREIEAALELNPGSSFYVGVTGYLLILADEWERGRPLLEKAIAMNPCHPPWFLHGLVVDFYMRGDFEAAYQETLKPAFGVHFWGPLLRAAVLGQLGRAGEARVAAAELVGMVPDFESRARDLTSRPILSEAVVDALLDGLRKAGLRTRDA